MNDEHYYARIFLDSDSAGSTPALESWRPPNTTVRPLPSPLLRSPTLPSFSSPPLPLEVGPHVAARGSGAVLKLPQRVQAEPSRQTHFGAFLAKIKASGGSNFNDFPEQRKHRFTHLQNF